MCLFSCPLLSLVCLFWWPRRPCVCVCVADPKLRRVYGHEAEKGRHKRRLFTEVHDMTKAKGRPQLTLHQLMAMPSSFDPSAGVSDTTIILNQWSR